MNIYKCKNCNCHSTKWFKDIIKHIKNKKKCDKNLESFEYTKDQILFLSLLPSNRIDINDIKNIKNISFLDDNKDKLIDILIENTNKKSAKLCIYCNKKFDDNIDLRKHIIIHCFNEQFINNKKNTTSINTLTKDSYNSTTNNIINITNNITVEIKNPIPFNEDWDLKKLSEDEKGALLHSMKMYTTFLKKILENDENLNVILDKESAYVYENDNKKYIKMNLSDVLSKTMEKINKQLIDINSNNEDMIKEALDLSKKYIKEKFDKYKVDNELKNRVNEILSNIYEEKKDSAIKISKNIVNIYKNGY